MLSFSIRSSHKLRPQVGTLVAIKAAANEPLAGVPGRLTAVVQRVRSGDYLVTISYDQPHIIDHSVLSEIDVFLSELELVAHSYDMNANRADSSAPA